MKRSIDHDLYVAKNRALAVAEDMKRRDETIERPGDGRNAALTGSCFTCKTKLGCSEFKARRSGRSTGVVSFGGDEKFVCERYVPAPAQGRAMSDKQIKALMKNVRNGY
jgi:hypothetical protein